MELLNFEGHPIFSRESNSTPSPGQTSVSVPLVGEGLVNGNIESCKIQWSLDEDLLLVSAWLNTSNAPVVGADHGGFWGKVTEYFANYSPPGVRVRKKTEIHYRWCTSSQLVSNFSGIFNEVAVLNPSGKSFKDMVVEAHESYLVKTGKKFNLEHMWRALSNEDKWVSHLFSSKCVKIETGAHSNSPIQGSQDQSINNNAVENEQIHRIGKKTAKRKANGERTISVDEVSSLGQIEAEQNEILRKYVTIQEEVEIIKEGLRLRGDLKKMKEREYEMKVMSKETSSMRAPKAAFWQARKVEIMTRYNEATLNNKCLKMDSLDILDVISDGDSDDDEFILPFFTSSSYERATVLLELRTATSSRFL